MSTLTIHTQRILDNVSKLDAYLSRQHIKWTLVTKILCGYKPALEKILSSPLVQNLHSVGDSRITNLKIIKSINPDIVTMYIKPPALNQVKKVVSCADISLNTSYRTISALNEEAGKQGKIHKIIVMLEMGELREGIARENVLDFYEKSFSLPHIQIIGLGTNLGCMHGVEPTFDKLIQLTLFKQLLEAKFNQKLEVLSGGSSITLPILTRKRVPREVNHFRIGETAFLGNDLLNGKRFRKLSTSAFDFSAVILELKKKASVPEGKISDAAVGHTADTEEQDSDTALQKSYRSIMDFGELDVDVKGLSPRDKTVEFAGTTSDMTVYDIGETKSKYRVGSKIHFKPNYIAIARIMNSRYITKKVV